MYRAYYNEFDPFAAEWLKILIACGHIADGDVDTRSIEDVKPSDLAGYTQCHFFAGIGGWSYALRLAGWPDSTPVWSGSAPCQPWSIANVAHGGGKGKDDKRHLLSYFGALVRECQPNEVFGEQVPNAIKKGWLDELQLELENYCLGNLILSARLAGTDHQRKRLFWMAYSRSKGRTRHKPVECVFITKETPFAFTRDTFLRARRIMDHDYESILPCNGLSVVMERSALKGYGNAIVPQVAAQFIRSYMELHS